MAFTGQLGTAASAPGNILLGYVYVPPPPPVGQPGTAGNRTFGSKTWAAWAFRARTFSGLPVIIGPLPPVPITDAYAPGVLVRGQYGG